MWWATALAFAMTCSVAACDCGDDTSGADAGRDAGRDAARDAGRDSGRDSGPPNRGTTTVFVPSAGGDVESPSYRLRVSVGAPQPMGSSSSPSTRAVTGPAASGR
jgi:hypothetical protein